MTKRWQALESKYQIQDVYTGGEAIVLKALDIQLNRTVAIKTPGEQVLANPKRLKKFIEEGRKLARLDNEHVLKVWSFHEPGDLDENCYGY